jgi:hypothetical protein
MKPVPLIVVEGDPRRGPIQDEEISIAQEALRRGFEVRVASLRQLPGTLSSPVALVAGGLPFVETALRSLNVPIPDPVDYPPIAQHFYRRTMCRSTVGNVLREIERGGPPMFVKPAQRRKRFTGLVVSGPKDLWRLASVSRSLTVHCSSVVEWRTEWRAFANRGVLVGLRHYEGDPEAVPDLDVVRSMITEVRETDAPVSFALDVGVLADDGETALVEMNEGFAIGRYGLESDVYFDLIAARWAELTKSDGVATAELDEIPGPEVIGRPTIEMNDF